MEKLKQMLSEKALKEFREIYRKKFGKELNEKDTLDKALRLLNLYKAVYGPNKSSQANINQLDKHD